MYISTCRVESYEVYGRKNSITKYKRSSTDARRTPVQSKYSFRSRLPNHEHLILFASSIAKIIMLYSRHTRKLSPSLLVYQWRVKMVQVLYMRQVSIQVLYTWCVAVFPYSPRLH